MELTHRHYTLIGLLAIVLMALINCCSPLYGTNPWCDANIYFTIGKQMWNGMVPFRDIYDQKGPVMYMVHAIGSIAGGRTYFGIWLLHILCCAVTMVQFVRMACHG